MEYYRQDEILQRKQWVLQETVALIQIAGGDGRKLYNTLEILYLAAEGDTIVITDQYVIDAVQQNIARYDKGGDQHYDIISAMIKSIRGSDPNAAVYWLARMLAGGEDIKFIGRRLVISASEDIGLANPNALLIANAGFQAIHTIGMPEARIVLSEVAIYLATSAKSNSAYLAIEEAASYIQQTPNQPVPLHLRNAPTRLMKSLDYGKDYQYAHAFPDHFIPQEYMPDQASGQSFYRPQNNPSEEKIRERMSLWWQDKYQT